MSDNGPFGSEETTDYFESDIFVVHSDTNHFGSYLDSIFSSEIESSPVSLRNLESELYATKISNNGRIKYIGFDKTEFQKSPIYDLFERLSTIMMNLSYSPAESEDFQNEMSNLSKILKTEIYKKAKNGFNINLNHDIPKYLDARDVSLNEPLFLNSSKDFVSELENFFLFLQEKESSQKINPIVILFEYARRNSTEPIEKIAKEIYKIIELTLECKDTGRNIVEHAKKLGIYSRNILETSRRINRNHPDPAVWVAQARAALEIMDEAQIQQFESRSDKFSKPIHFLIAALVEVARADTGLYPEKKKNVPNKIKIHDDINAIEGLSLKERLKKAVVIVFAPWIKSWMARRLDEFEG